MWVQIRHASMLAALPDQSNGGTTVLFGAAKPILPGKMGRARRLAEELTEHRVEYEALNARFRLNAHAMWASHLSSGLDLWVNVYDIEPDDLQAMGNRAFDPESSDYDRWYTGWCRDVLGVDVLASGGFAAPPEPLFSWAEPKRRVGVIPDERRDEG